MNKDLKIITVKGFKGALIIAYLIFGLISGFVIAPSIVCMKLSNILITKYTSLMPMNILQGLMMWAVIALTFCALNRGKTLIKFGTYSNLTSEQINNIIKRAKIEEDDVQFDELVNNEISGNNVKKSDEQEEVKGKL